MKAGAPFEYHDYNFKGLRVFYLDDSEFEPSEIAFPSYEDGPAIYYMAKMNMLTFLEMSKQEKKSVVEYDAEYADAYLKALEDEQSI